MRVDVRSHSDRATPRIGQTAEAIEIAAPSNRSTDSVRSIVETASEGIWTIDEENLTTLVNPALTEILGYEPQEMLGKSV